MKNKLLIILIIIPMWIGAQNQVYEEVAQPAKNAISISGGTSFCKDKFFNPTYDLQYSRLLWKGLFFSAGYNWRHHTIEKVSYSTGEYKWNFYYAFTGYLGLGWKFDITERLSLSPSITWGRSFVLWDFYTSHSGAKRRSNMFSCSAEYTINRRWSVFGTYSYTIQGKDIYLVWHVWSNEHGTKIHNSNFAETKANNEFNCHDLKLGISFRF